MLRQSMTVYRHRLSDVIVLSATATPNSNDCQLLSENPSAVTTRWYLGLRLVLWSNVDMTLFAQEIL